MAAETALSQSREAVRKPETAKSSMRGLPELTQTMDLERVQRVAVAPGLVIPSNVSALQRAVGNAGVSRLIRAKSTFSPPDASGWTAIQRDTRKNKRATTDVPKLSRGWEKALLDVMNQNEDAEVLKILIDGELLHAGPEVYAALYARLSPQNPPASDKLAVKFNQTFKGEIRQRLLDRFEEVGRYYKPITPGWEKALLDLMNQNEDPELIEIEIFQDILFGQDLALYEALFTRLSAENPPANDKLAARFNRTFKGNLRKRVRWRFQNPGRDLRDYEEPDPFPQLAPGIAPGREAQAVHQFGRIDAPLGVRLSQRPGTRKQGRILPFDTLVMIDHKTIEKKGQQSWLYVVALGNDKGNHNVTDAVGFVEEYYVAQKPPEPTAHLYLVKPGDMLKDIVEKYYGQKYDWGNDGRLYVQAIYHANKERDVVFRQNPDLTVDREALETTSLKKAHELWRKARVVQGQALWVPSDEFVQKLKAAGVIHHASISKAVWDATIGAIDTLISWAKYAAGFVIGLLKGAWNAIVDFFEGAAEMLKTVAELLYNLITGNLGAIKDMLKNWIKKLKLAWENRSQIADDFMKKWEAKNDWDRGLFQGEVLGWVLMNVLIAIFTGGSGAVANITGKWAAVIKVLSSVEKLGNVTTYLGKAIKLPGKVIKFASSKLGRGVRRVEHAAEVVVEDAARTGGRVVDDAAAAGKAGTRAATDLVSSFKPVAVLGKHELGIGKVGNRLAVILCSKNCAAVIAKAEAMLARLPEGHPARGELNRLITKAGKTDAFINDVLPDAKFVNEEVNQIKQTLEDIKRRYPDAIDPNIAPKSAATTAAKTGEDVAGKQETVEDYLKRTGKQEKDIRVDSGPGPKEQVTARPKSEEPKLPDEAADMQDPKIVTRIDLAEDHHIATRYRKKNAAIFKRAGISIDDDMNLMKNFQEHGQLRGWYKWKERRYKFEMRGHHPEYNNWVTKNLEHAVPRGLAPDQALDKLQKVLGELEAAILKHPELLSHGPGIFQGKLPKDLAGLIL